jgi:hypothetical protein
MICFFEGTSWNISGSKTVLSKSSSLVATLPKNSFSIKKVATLSLKINVHLILRISEGFGQSEYGVSVSARKKE